MRILAPPPYLKTANYIELGSLWPKRLGLLQIDQDHAFLRVVLDFQYDCPNGLHSCGG